MYLYSIKSFDAAETYKTTHTVYISRSSTSIIFCNDRITHTNYKSTASPSSYTVTHDKTTLLFSHFIGVSSLICIKATYDHFPYLFSYVFFLKKLLAVIIFRYVYSTIGYSFNSDTIYSHTPLLSKCIKYVKFYDLWRFLLKFFLKIVNLRLQCTSIDFR